MYSGAKYLLTLNHNQTTSAHLSFAVEYNQLTKATWYFYTNVRSMVKHTAPKHSTLRYYWGDATIPGSLILALNSQFVTILTVNPIQKGRKITQRCQLLGYPHHSPHLAATGQAQNPQPESQIPRHDENMLKTVTCTLLVDCVDGMIVH